MGEISLDQFIGDYLKGLISQPIVVKNRIYGKTIKGVSDGPSHPDLVWAIIP